MSDLKLIQGGKTHEPHGLDLVLDRADKTGWSNEELWRGVPFDASSKPITLDDCMRVMMKELYGCCLRLVGKDPP